MGQAHQAYPLSWPAGWERTKTKSRSLFKTTFDRARGNLILELERMNASGIVLSTNVHLRNDGFPYSKHSPPEDPGVAIYFTVNKKQLCMACDRWDSVCDNIQALKLSIEALRGIDRWGCSTFLDRAFSGFQALPPSSEEKQPWWEVLDIHQEASREDIKERYRQLAKKYHPDFGGSTAQMSKLNNAFEEACGYGQNN